MTSGLRGLVLALTLMLSGTAHAELHALLVGVSGYPNLPERMRLQGPRNDVLRMRQVLVQRGFREEHIRLLADGVPGAQPPTRANILQALDQLGAGRGSGDTVFIHFAGHGSRQPAADARGWPDADLPAAGQRHLERRRPHGGATRSPAASCASVWTASPSAVPSSGACSTPATRPRWCAAPSATSCAIATSIRPSWA